jgi:hypothetical protein
MSKKIYHILNGDALHQKWPRSISGETIIMRECLITGPAAAPDYATFCAQRAQYVQTEFGEADYSTRVIGEWSRIQAMEADSTVYLWFEKDLFCQVNLWFVLHLMRPIYDQIKLVLPLTEDWSGFGNLNEQELFDCYYHHISLDAEDILKIRQLWEAYALNDFEIMTLTSLSIKPSLPFISRAVGLHFDRVDTEQMEGRPKRILRQIIKKEGKDHFDRIYRKFWEQAKEFGYGDDQVRQLLNQVLQSSNYWL